MSDTPSSTPPQQNETSSPQNHNEAQPSLNMDAFARVPLVDTISLTSSLREFSLDQEVVYPAEISVGQISTGSETSSSDGASATVASSALMHMSAAPALAPTPIPFTYAELIAYLAANGRARPRMVIVCPEDDVIDTQDLAGDPDAPLQLDNVDGA